MYNYNNLNKINFTYFFISENVTIKHNRLDFQKRHV